MFFAKNKHVFAQNADGIQGDFPESLVNPLYKPKTLAELRAEMIHTGINPAPASLRDPFPVSDGVDPMDAPPIPVTGDRFEHIRQAKAISSKVDSLNDELNQAQDPEPTPVPEPASSPQE